MEVTDANLQTLSGYLEQTLQPDPTVRKQAEKFLQSVERNERYPQLLLSLLDSQSFADSTRIASAVTFKNFVKRNWKDDEGMCLVAEDDRVAVRRSIVELMTRSPEPVQRQLSDAISIIGRHDFPAQWPELLAHMTTKFASGDFHVINGCLRTAQSIFERYRFEFKSNELWLEIKYVLENFAKPLTDLFLATIGCVEQHKDNAGAVKVLVSSLVLISEIFYLLNYQDLPEFFEDNMSTWMPRFLQLLQYDNQLLQNQDEDEPGLLEQLRSQICDNITLYAQKYEEEFAEYLAGFVTAVWSLLTITGPQAKYDLLVSNAIKFMSTVVERTQNAHLFQSEEILPSICEKVIVPNMEFRVSDEELFEDNADEYIRRDVLGSDIDTRRRAACDLVKSLSRQFEQRITQVFAHYVQVMLTRCSENRAACWKSKDSAVFLVTSLAARGSTQKHGATQISSLVNLDDFYTAHILPELQDRDLNQFPVLKADALKYVMVFRSQLNAALVLPSIPNLVSLLRAPSVVVHSYAAMAIEKLLIVRSCSDQTPLVKGSDLAGVANELFSNLLHCLTLPASQENEYVMKCIMRSCSCLQEAAIPHLATLLPRLTEIVQTAAKNPSKPHFNHFMFETLALSIRIVCQVNPAQVSTFESTLFPIFQHILQQDVQEFIPYVFQLLSLMLEVQSSVTEPYQKLLPFLLAPALWQTSANVPPLVRFLCACVRRQPDVFVRMEKLPAVLGIFQKLNASRVNDHHGFSLLMTLFENMPIQMLEPYVRQVLELMFQRLTVAKTVKYIRSTLVFLYYFAHVCGGAKLIAVVDQIQPKMFCMVVERLIVLETQKVSGNQEKLICTAGLVALLCDTQPLVQGEYDKYWAPVMQALIGLIELPEQTEDDPSGPAGGQQDAHFREMDEGPGYQAAFSQLVFALAPKVDPLKGGVQEPRQYVIQGLQRMSRQWPGRLNSLISSGHLQADTATCLQRYAQTLGVALN